MPQSPAIRVAEMFAGVGGFRLALDGYSNPQHPEFTRPAAGPYQTIWANQWEPGTDAKQFAWRCYEQRFGQGSCINIDINKVMDEAEAGVRTIPDFDLLVGGFPCQDYSVAKPLARAGGIEGKKGVLWWDIYRMIQLKSPRYLLLENVDRLISSTAQQRGKDFAIILSCLAQQGYAVEWRIINAADYGMPQKRKRVYIFAEKTTQCWNLEKRLLTDGVLAASFKAAMVSDTMRSFPVGVDPFEVSQTFGLGLKVTPFQNAGVMQNNTVLTAKMQAVYEGPQMVLADIVVPDAEVPATYFIDPDKLSTWEYLRSAKRLTRTAKNGFSYEYAEGAMAFPDPLDRPARTILTGEGGAGASRMKHAIKGDSGKIRRLVPDELDQIQMFPKGWTKSGMTDGQRAFCMGNALVVGIPHTIGKELARRVLCGSKSSE